MFFSTHLKAAFDDENNLEQAALFHTICYGAEYLENNCEKELGLVNVLPAVALQIMPNFFGSAISSYVAFRAFLPLLAFTGKILNTELDEATWKQTLKELPYQGAKLCIYTTAFALLNDSSVSSCVECSAKENFIPAILLVYAGLSEIFKKRSYAALSCNAYEFLVKMKTNLFDVTISPVK